MLLQQQQQHHQQQKQTPKPSSCGMTASGPAEPLSKVNLYLSGWAIIPVLIPEASVDMSLCVV